MLIAMTLRCLIVDDSQAVVRSAREHLERQGITVIGSAATGLEAMSLARDLEPDVVLVDIDLGGESGFDLVRRLVQTLDTAGSRTILISTHDEADFADLIAASPAIGFVSKSDLSATVIRGLLDRHEAEVTERRERR
ncbi:MAG TPA: response regulator transcription factor [Solirubrobacteraceae bacterium]|nr:response regulator transcription factor [Solirubrobacteraceae bacterium]